MQLRTLLSTSLFSLLFIEPAFSITVEHSQPVACADRPLNDSTYTTTSGAINPTTDTIGGGPKYSRIIGQAQANITVVHNANDLTAALLAAANANATAAQKTIFLDPTQVFNLSGLVVPIAIPAGTTLASNRGELLANGQYSEGALMEFDSGGITGNIGPIFAVAGNNVRITGLRFLGPYSIIDESSSLTMYEVTGIKAAASAGNIEIDNTELYGWSLSAIRLDAAKQAYIHHNYIHHNHNKYFYTNTGPDVEGYGVVLYGDADALIEANIFDYNRHTIAGDGDGGQSYEARYNVVQQHISSHAFDMHPFATNPQVAGNEIYIHHNTFLSIQANTGVPYNLLATGVAIRAVPSSCAWIEYNGFADSSASAARQLNTTQIGPVTTHFGSLTTNQFDARGLLSTNGAVGEWVGIQATPVDLSSVYIGDFDGDGKSDIFKSENGYWKIASGGNGPWQTIDFSAVPFGELRFGDFDGDGKTDVFHIDVVGGVQQWKVAYSGQGSWQTLNSSAYPLASLRFGDFNGDGKTDVFHINSSGQWEVSWSGTSSWQTINTPTVNTTIDHLRFGDFDGDGKTDVFYADGTSWWVSYSGTSAWTKLHDSVYTESDLKFGDFNGDKKTDILSMSSSGISISFGGNTNWQPVNKIETGMTIGNTGVADFNGDGKAEILWNGVPDLDAQCTSAGC